MSEIFLVDLESVTSRYTGQWKTCVPALLRERGHNVTVISGPTDIPAATTPGAFLNFGGTNVYKAVQVEQIGRLFCENKVQPGSHFIFTDAWHPGIINLKYMSELLGIPVVTHGLWHAGSYDSQDFLGRLIGDAHWVRSAEASFFHAFDHNYYATDFHIDLFSRTFGFEGAWDAWRDINLVENKIVRTGWPMEYMPDLLTEYNQLTKRDLILFPHRIAPEKQVEIFRDLATQLPQYEFVVCQDHALTKDEYHKLLGEAKVVFSANLQETLGISCYEGAILGAVPVVPDRLSYSEMYDRMFKYPSVWTESYDQYLVHRGELCDRIIDTMTNYDSLCDSVHRQAQSLSTNFFSATNLINNLS